MNHKAPHRPWEPDAKHAHLYTDPIALPATWEDDYATRSASRRRAAMRVADHLTVTDLKQPVPEGLSYEEAGLWKYQRYMEDYLRVVASVDDNVGRVVDWLRDRGEFDDTVLMYFSDQGFFLGDHGWFDKRFMYEQSLRMPLVMSYPRAVAGGQVHDGIATNVDFAQSFLAADGMYYRYWEHDDHDHNASAHHGYRTQRYKLIYFYNDGLGLPGASARVHPPEWELYDMQVDPDELHNVADDPAYAVVRAEITVAMGRAQSAVDDRPHPSQDTGGRREA